MKKSKKVNKETIINLLIDRGLSLEPTPESILKLTWDDWTYVLNNLTYFIETNIAFSIGKNPLFDQA